MVDTVTSESGAVGAGSATPTGPSQYVKDAIRIARFDDDAIGRIAGDRKALKYGACVIAIAAVLLYIPAQLFGSGRPSEGGLARGLGLAVGIPVVVLVQLVLSALQVAVIHGLGKVLLGATGSFIGLLRVLWLGSIVSWLGIVPVVGPIVGGIWYLLITLVTFETVDGLERLQALVLVVVVAAAMFFLGTLFW